LLTPAEPVVSTDSGVAFDKFAFSVTLLLSGPPPFNPVPAITWREVGTNPLAVDAAVVAAITRPVASIVMTGISVLLPYTPGVTPELANSVVPIPPGATESVTLLSSWPPPVSPVPAIT
jgi:hypothetical protein